MYINEVIRRVDRLYPNEYTTAEKYDWCDDLSAMLCQEYIRKYDAVTLKADLDGTYLLPEGVTFEMIDKVRAKGNVIEKLDFRSFGIEPMYGRHRQFYIPSRCGGGDEIEVVYLRRSEPIRDTVIECNAEFRIIPNEDGYCTVKYIGSGLAAGDTVNIRVIDKSITIVDEETGKQTYVAHSVKNVPILKIGMDGDQFILYVPVGSISDLRPTKPSGVNVFSGESTIERVITDETVCDAPYDMMYVDYVLAQIFYYQRNYPSYNQHINLFNQRLEAYERWLQKRRVQEKDNKIYNWW